MLNHASELYFFAYDKRQLNNVVSGKIKCGYPTLYIPKSSLCFSKQPLYAHTKSNSIKTIITLLANLTHEHVKGFVYDMEEGKTYDLSQISFVEGVKGIELLYLA